MKHETAEDPAGLTDLGIGPPPEPEPVEPADGPPPVSEDPRRQQLLAAGALLLVSVLDDVLAKRRPALRMTDAERMLHADAVAQYVAIRFPGFDVPPELVLAACFAPWYMRGRKLERAQARAAEEHKRAERAAPADVVPPAERGTDAAPAL